MAINKFQPFRVQSESASADGKPSEMRVVKSETAQSTPVTYQFEKLDKNQGRTYSTVKAKFGPLAATDPERRARTQKDSRFTLNPLLRGPLSVEEEEKRVIEEQVANRIKSVEESVRQQADQRGYQEGLKKGYEEAFQKFKVEGADRLSKLDALIASLETAKTKIFEENEKVLVDIMFRIAKTIVLKEVESDPAFIVRLAKDLIERVGTRDNISVLINPNDMKSVGMLKDGITAALGELKNLRIEPSPEVKGGGCIVETEFNAIDAAVETQLRSIHDSLLPKKTAEN